MKKYVYLCVYILPITVIVSVVNRGWWCSLPILFIFILVPFLELFIPSDESNLNAIERSLAEDDLFYEWLLLAFVVLHPFILFLFLKHIDDPNLTLIEWFGRIFSMGIINGACAINVAHELGHRKEKWKQRIADILLLTSLENHFRPYHTYMHHKHVATKTDPATAKRGEWAYLFWFKEQTGTYIQAWQVEKANAIEQGAHPFSLKNNMVIFTIAQFTLIIFIYFTMGLSVLIGFLLAAFIGMIILAETSYIEHYGLLRKKQPNGRYEKVTPKHSWNSNHPLGRILLFELSRHSDHHYKAHKSFQTLDHLENSPQMPTGYPGMMILSLFPPLWFSVMHKKLDNLK